MNDNGAIWIGVDPGGKRNFGLAILRSDGSSQTWCVDCAEDAIKIIQKKLDRIPSGIGIDAPLWWSSGKSGDRSVDQWLRQHYRLSGGEVQAANSLRGAALIQAAMFVQRVREVFPSIPVTESHPKALLKGLYYNDWAEFSDCFKAGDKPNTDHERDALISAVSAREGFECRWQNDLSLSVERLTTEQNPKKYWLAPIHYFWPE
ncbi:MAG: DUF429 domain-containing protein [Dehalogenimonas sp.]|uniref:DUF429 domain-containing protein n=1 Tax=Candidatus Dehalogenimonas loeffleri TaxID=3127115 RepID=A0ABZ2JAF7_9CHLR|nr:DUF429 domain-containing protein [Dehalogenimonas sp.]